MEIILRVRAFGVICDDLGEPKRVSKWPALGCDHCLDTSTIRVVTSRAPFAHAGHSRHYAHRSPFPILSPAIFHHSLRQSLTIA